MPDIIYLLINCHLNRVTPFTPICLFFVILVKVPNHSFPLSRGPQLGNRLVLTLPRLMVCWVVDHLDTACTRASTFWKQWLPKGTWCIHAQNVTQPPQTTSDLPAPVYKRSRTSTWRTCCSHCTCRMCRRTIVFFTCAARRDHASQPNSMKHERSYCTHQSLLAVQHYVSSNIVASWQMLAYARMCENNPFHNAHIIFYHTFKVNGGSIYLMLIEIDMPSRYKLLLVLYNHCTLTCSVQTV